MLPKELWEFKCIGHCSPQHFYSTNLWKVFTTKWKLMEKTREPILSLIKSVEAISMTHLVLALLFQSKTSIFELEDHCLGLEKYCPYI